MKDDMISRQAAINVVRTAKDKSEAHRMLVQLPPAQPSVSKTEIVGDVISRQAAIDAVESVETPRVFQGIIVEYPTISTYPEYEGKPYFSIKYTENGQGFIGYGTYKPEVLSEYLKEYFMPPTQPGCEDAVSRSHFDKRVRLAGGMSEEELTDDFKDGVLTVLEMLRTEPPVTPKQPGWIPTSVRLPEEKTCVLITTTKGYVIQCMYWGYQNGHHTWRSLGGEHLYWEMDVLAWCELPTPYREGGQE